MLMSNTFLRTHIIDIADLKFRHSKRFRLSRKAYNQHTDNLIIDYHPSVYIRFEDEFQQERLLIRWSWTLLIFTLSFLNLLLSLFFLEQPYLVFPFICISVVLFIFGIISKKQCDNFSFNIDFSHIMITEDTVNNVRIQLLEKQNQSPSKN